MTGPQACVHPSNGEPAPPSLTALIPVQCWGNKTTCNKNRKQRRRERSPEEHCAENAAPKSRRKETTSTRITKQEVNVLVVEKLLKDGQEETQAAPEANCGNGTCGADFQVLNVEMLLYIVAWGNSPEHDLAVDAVKRVVLLSG